MDTYVGQDRGYLMVSIYRSERDGMEVLERLQDEECDGVVVPGKHAMSREHKG